MKTDTLLIDGSYMGMVSHHAPYKLTTETGLNATLVHAFLKSLISLKKKFMPGRIVVAWESYGTVQWRKELYGDYKKGRKKMDNMYWDAVRDVQALVGLLGVEQFRSPHNEADDVIAAMAKGRCVIFTTDKDLMQLVGEKVMVWNGNMLFDSKEVKKKYLVEPKQIPDLLAIWGDSSDNIKGVDGYGVVKAAKLLGRCSDIEGIGEDDVIYEHKKRLLFNKKLTTLMRDCKLVKVKEDGGSIDDILDKYELKKIRNAVMTFNGKQGLDKWLS